MAKPVRPIPEINKDYNQKVATMGHLHWQLEKIPAQIESLKLELRTLDREADESQKQQIKEEQAKISKSLNKDKVPPIEAKTEDAEQSAAGPN